MVLIGNIFGFLGSLLGSIIQSDSAQRQQQAANAANMELAKYQNEQNFLQWQRENEYNTPVNQLNRLKEAGINPALINGSTVDAGTASPLRYTRATVNPLPGINLGLDTMAQLELVGSQIELNRARARKENASAGNDEWQLEFNKSTEELQRNFLALKNDNTKANTDKLLASIRQVDEQLAQSHNLMEASLNFTQEQINTLVQARDYQIKEYNLKQWQVGQAVKQGWQSLSISGALAASTIERNNWLNNLTSAEIGEIYEKTKNLIVDGKNKELDNYLKQLDAYFKEKGLKVGGSPLQLINLLFALPLDWENIPERTNIRPNSSMPVRPRTVTGSGYDNQGHYYEVSE